MPVATGVKSKDSNYSFSKNEILGSYLPNKKDV